MTKICANCIYCSKTPEGNSALWKCTHAPKINKVDGTVEVKYCKTERLYPMEDACGPDGRFFEPYERF